MQKDVQELVEQLKWKETKFRDHHVRESSIKQQVIRDEEQTDND